MVVAVGMLFAAARADAQLGGLMDKAKGAAQSGAKTKVEKEVNDKLLAEGRKNQCSFKTDSDQLMPGCDSSGKADHNKELSGKRAAVMVKELVGRGISPGEIISVGMGSDRPLVTPDNTPATLEA